MTFKQFVMSQPANRTINQTGGWEDCAVGDYDAEILGHNCVLTHIFDTVETCLSGDEQLRTCLGGYGKPLNNDDEYGCIPDRRRENIINTYGDLQDYYNGKLNLLTGEKSV